LKVEYLWLAFVLALLIVAVVDNRDTIRDSFLKLSPIVRILVGFAVWLVSVVAPFVAFFSLNEPEEGPGLDVMDAFLVIWPPAWPIALILLLLRGFRWLFSAQCRAERRVRHRKTKASEEGLAWQEIQRRRQFRKK
jgi:hypothetical protein